MTDADMSDDDRAEILFLDIEASGLDERAYPIEIGWVGQDGIGDSILIRPPSHWSYWSWKAEWVHRISREMLGREGVDAPEAARRVAAIVGGRIVYVDAPEWDGHWLRMLLAEGRVSPNYDLRDTARAMSLALAPLEPGQMGRAILVKARAHADGKAPRTHRALPDARHAWTMWREVSRLVAETAA
jgi:hypothetical protein